METIVQRLALPAVVKDMTAILAFAKSKEAQDWLKKADVIIAELNERIAEVGVADEIDSLRLRALSDRTLAMTELNTAKEKAATLLAGANDRIKEIDERAAEREADLEMHERESGAAMKLRENEVAEREKAAENRHREATKAKEEAEAAHASATLVKEDYDRRVKVLEGRLKAARAA